MADEIECCTTSSTSRCVGHTSARNTGLPSRVLAQRIFPQIDVDASGQSERHHQRRRHQIIRADIRIDAAFEVAIAGKHRGHHQILSSISSEISCRQRSRIPDAGGASVADDMELQLFQIGRQARHCPDNRGPLSIPAQAKSSPTSGTCSPRSTAFFASRPAAIITEGFEVLVQLVMAAMTTLLP